jgi:hypothetical protein
VAVVSADCPSQDSDLPFDAPLLFVTDIVNAALPKKAPLNP